MSLTPGRAATDCSTGEQKALLIAIVLAHARLQAELRGVAPVLLLEIFALQLVLAFTITAFGVMVAARIKQIQSFMAVTQMVMMPMYFLSGAIFPVSGLPAWLTILNRLDPLTYAVDPMRRLVFSHLRISAVARRTLDPGVTWWGWHVPTLLEAAVVVVIGLACLAVGIVEFSGRE